jgi:hypothetical protein
LISLSLIEALIRAEFSLDHDTASISGVPEKGFALSSSPVLAASFLSLT